MKIRKIALTFGAAGLLSAALAGCGSNMSSGGEQTTGNTGTFGTDANGIKYVGAETCIGCHEGFTWSDDQVADFLAGPHVVHSDHINLDSEEECLACHNPVGDGKTLEGLIDPADVPAEGLAAVTCEACHGAGGEHYGVGDIPTPKPGPESCAGASLDGVGTACHTDLAANESSAGHQPYHPEGMDVYYKYTSSAHATAGNLRNSFKCVRCHNHEGAQAYKGITTAQALSGALPLDSVSKIQCATCHNAHNPDELLMAATVTSGTQRRSAEYNTCINCHQAPNTLLSTGTAYVSDGLPLPETGDTGLVKLNSQGTGYDTLLMYHAKRWDRIIATTHYDLPSTPDFVEGYIMSTASDRTCRDCHDVHRTDLTINEEWASSGHAGEILEAKETAAEGATDDTLEQTVAVQAAGSDGDAFSWGHYDWDSAGRASCQVCHTATGIKNFLTSPNTYTSSMNSFAYFTSTGQNELLYCWGCHSDNQGALRNPEISISLSYTYNSSSVRIPDVGSSNVCVKCHSGRGNLDSIKVTNLSTLTEPIRFAGHHAPTGSTLFSQAFTYASDTSVFVPNTGTHVGYEFAGQNYDNLTYFAHANIGLDLTTYSPGTAETGRGPCVTCHMSMGEGHTFWIVTKDEGTGEITDIANSALQVCNGCHTGQYEMSTAALETARKEFISAGELLAAYVTNDETNYQNIDLSLAASYTAGPGTLNDYGANANRIYVSSEENGAYVHNNFYVKRLIFDSIDWLDNGALDGQITITDAIKAAYREASEWFGADPDAAGDEIVNRPSGPTISQDN